MLGHHPAWILTLQSGSRLCSIVNNALWSKYTWSEVNPLFAVNGLVYSERVTTYNWEEKVTSYHWLTMLRLVILHILICCPSNLCSIWGYRWLGCGYSKGKMTSWQEICSGESHTHTLPNSWLSFLHVETYRTLASWQGCNSLTIQDLTRLDQQLCRVWST